MKAYLEQINNDWLDDFVYISKYPLIEFHERKIIPFDGEDLSSLEKLNINPKEDICIGSVEACTKFFELCNVPVPKAISYPEELKKYLGRDIIKTTFGQLGEDYPYFIKPSEDIKLFTGDVITKDYHKQLLKDFYNCTDSTPVFKSPIIDFVSEYRVFVSNGKIYGIKHYKGDFTKFIDPNVVKRMVDAYKDCPSAYTLDVGLTVLGETLLVEVNDMWAIGSYGLDGKTYALLCVRRMKEILNQH